MELGLVQRHHQCNPWHTPLVWIIKNSLLFFDLASVGRSESINGLCLCWAGGFWIRYQYFAHFFTNTYPFTYVQAVPEWPNGISIPTKSLESYQCGKQPRLDF